MKPKIEVRNMVITIIFSDEVNLKYLTTKLEGAEYSPEQFPGLVYRMKKPKTSFLIFSSGIMNCTGARSMPEAKKAIHQMVKKLKRLGVKIKKLKIEVQNIVATYDFNRRVDLDKLLTLEGTEYEPGQFPGLVYRSKTGVAFLVFATGKIVCVGARSMKQVKESIDSLIKDFKKIGALK